MKLLFAFLLQERIHVCAVLCTCTWDAFINAYNITMLLLCIKILLVNFFNLRYLQLADSFSSQYNLFNLLVHTTNLSILYRLLLM